MKQLSILLINTCTYRKVYVYPLGLDYLKSYIESNGYNQITTLDLALVPESRQKEVLFATLQSKSYDVVALSFRNITDQLYLGKKYTPVVKTLIALIRSATAMQAVPPTVVVGGAGFSILPEYLIDELGADYGVAGEGENAFLSILDAIKTGRTLEKIVTRPFPIQNIVYTRGTWGYLEEYKNLGAWGNIQTKRGCNRKCIYCSYPVIEGKLFRLRDPEIVAKEALKLQKIGFETIYIVDATFNNPLIHAKNILKAFKKHGVTAEWKGFFNPDIDDELLELIKETNLSLPLRFTIESGSNKMLDQLQKGFTTSYVERAISLCRKHNIPFAFTIMFGAPGETEETVRTTCQFIRKWKPDHVSAGLGVFVYPKTQLATQTKYKLWHHEKDLLGHTYVPFEREKFKKIIHEELTDSGIECIIYDELENLSNRVM